MRNTNTRPKLTAEQAERDLLLQLAHLADLAEAGVGRRVVVVRPAARRAA